MGEVDLRMTSEEAIKRLKFLRNLCGYVEDGSCTNVTIGQDDATREWVIFTTGTKNWWHGGSFNGAIDAAMADPKNKELLQ
jgi:hypothetical protein